ncbi:NnrU family protein [Falsiroseomonas bella]|uniref:NnrU family protein n=1 Tax=Falsiroseomonas bella TaxID=2184016 RepID=A0A317F8Z4_9PROT|nr:NnrU family protein [Falsiroseomonas bella]PWS35235.1 NnrU family protein [Falsiroseomonas bella]
MGGWGEYAAAWAVFLASHMLPARPALRGPIVDVVGERAFLAAYSALSILILAWMIGAAGRAPFVPVWGWAWWQAWVVNVAMVAACLLAALGVAVPNPFSIAGARNDRYDPARPGVLALTRHPVLLALALWSGAHLLPNGDLAHVLLFGPFAAISLLGMRALDARRRRRWGTGRFDALLPRGPARLAPARLAAGLALWAALAASHAAVIGVPPWPLPP